MNIISNNNSVFLNKELTAHDKAIFLTLCTMHLDKRNSVLLEDDLVKRPTMQDISEISQVGIRTVLKSIKRMCNLGILHIEEHGIINKILINPFLCRSDKCQTILCIDEKTLKIFTSKMNNNDVTKEAIKNNEKKIFLYLRIRM